MFPVSGVAPSFPGVPLTDDELRFIAWFLTDGTMSAAGRLRLFQAKPERVVEIRELLVRLGLHFSESVQERKGAGNYFPNALPLTCFRVAKTGRFGGLGWEKYALWLDKKIQPALHMMTVAQFEIFWAELLKGDGDGQARCSGLHCNLREQADAYSMMATLRGHAATIMEYTTSYGTPMYRISARKGVMLLESNLGQNTPSPTLASSSTPEAVWCVTNRNGTLITRREGKIIILGNCRPLGRALARKREGPVENPRVSVFAGSTVTYLERHTEPADWTGGFMARFLTMYCDRARTIVLQAGAPPGRELLVDKLKILWNSMETLPGECQGFTPAAVKLWTEWYYKSEARAKDGTEAVVAGIYRAHAMAQKVALLLAWDRGLARVGIPWKVDDEHLTYAINIVDLHIESVIEIGHKLAPTRDLRDRNSVLFAISEPMTEAQISKRAKIGLKRRLREILETLEMEGLIKAAKAADGTTTLYVPIADDGRPNAKVIPLFKEEAPKESSPGGLDLDAETFNLE